MAGYVSRGTSDQIGLCTGSETAHAAMIVIKKSMTVEYAILAPLLAEI